jgi:hypothetical protein
LVGFTYRRTQQRHISVAPKWTKRKKGVEAKDDDDEPSPQRAKRKYTKRKARHDDGMLPVWIGLDRFLFWIRF